MKYWFFDAINFSRGSLGYQLAIDSAEIEEFNKTSEITKFDAKTQAERLNEQVSYVQNCMMDITLNFLRMGRMLAEIEASYDFTKSEYISFEIFCSSKFDLGKTTLWNLIKIYKLFAERIKAEDKYRRYTYTQLAELVTLAGRPEEEIVEPSWTVSRIKAYKRELKKRDKGTEEVRKDKTTNKDLNDEIFTFADVQEVKLFLTKRSEWEMVGEVEKLNILFFRCYLSDGRQLIAEQCGTGRFPAAYYHFADEAGIFIHATHSIDKMAEILIKKELSVRYVSFDDRASN